jgi:DNA-binding MarR family transcriptional regulator
MFDAAKTLKKAVGFTSTYKAGLLQAKAYRVFKKHTGNLLQPYGINTLDWALLGLIFEAPKGVRLSTLALDLGVEAPLVTRMTSMLEKKGFVSFAPDATDSRARLAFLTQKGKESVNKIESMLRKEMKPLFKGLGVRSLVTYLTVLIKIVENAPLDDDSGAFY